LHTLTTKPLGLAGNSCLHICHIIIVNLVVCSVGKTTNYAVVVAMLFSLGQNHGTHLFIVQLRDMETHKPMPGWIKTVSLLCRNIET